jgi:hypothetical protein
MGLVSDCEEVIVVVTLKRHPCQQRLSTQHPTPKLAAYRGYVRLQRRHPLLPPITSRYKLYPPPPSIPFVLFILLYKRIPTREGRNLEGQRLLLLAREYGYPHLKVGGRRMGPQHGGPFYKGDG